MPSARLANIYHASYSFWNACQATLWSLYAIYMTVIFISWVRNLKVKPVRVIQLYVLGLAYEPVAVGFQGSELWSSMKFEDNMHTIQLLLHRSGNLVGESHTETQEIITCKWVKWLSMGAKRCEEKGTLTWLLKDERTLQDVRGREGHLHRGNCSAKTGAWKGICTVGNVVLLKRKIV